MQHILSSCSTTFKGPDYTGMTNIVAAVTVVCKGHHICNEGLEVRITILTQVITPSAGMRLTQQCSLQRLYRKRLNFSLVVEVLCYHLPTAHRLGFY
ncbi:MAG TPA: hypothetical protein DG414_00055, partial [Gammaproteobacteria bacterium]|nr:hypothetical protein [Gammaproteobacteria bacterium]